MDINPVQDTPVATRKEDTYIHFSVDVEIQRHVEKLPKGNVNAFISKSPTTRALTLGITSVRVLPGAAIFFEFKHYKPKKKFTSTKCFAFMEMDEIKAGPIVIEL